MQWISSVTADIGEAFNAPTYALDDFGAYVVSGQSGAATTATSTSETACEFFENFINQQIFENKVISFIQRYAVGHSFPVAFRLEKKLVSDDYPSGVSVSVRYFFNYTDLLEFKYYV